MWVGLTDAPVAITDPSTTRRFGTSWQRCHASTTESSGSEPMRAVPSRCQPRSVSKPSTRTESAPAAWQSSVAFSIPASPMRREFSDSV